MSVGNLFTLYHIQASIGTSFTPGEGSAAGTWTYAELNNGLDNVAEALNEVVQQYFFLNDGGFARNHVTGMAPAFTFSGRRVQGDVAQEYIFGNKYKLDTNRLSNFKLVIVDNSGAAPKTSTLTADCTICNIQEWSGASTDDSAISFEVRFDGAPTLTES